MLANTKNTDMNRKLLFSPFAKTWIKPSTLMTFSKLTSLTKNYCSSKPFSSCKCYSCNTKIKRLIISAEKMKCLIVSSEKTKCLQISWEKKLHYFFRTKSSASLFLQKKISIFFWRNNEALVVRKEACVLH